MSRCQPAKKLLKVFPKKPTAFLHFLKAIHNKYSGLKRRRNVLYYKVKKNSKTSLYFRMQ